MSSRKAPRPGFVLDVDSSTPPILFHHGEGFRLERLPVGRSRVIYPAEPLRGVEDPDQAIRDALENTIEMEPLRAHLFSGMKLTIAFDDISLPLPPMRRPDIRQRIIEAVLDLAAEAGVDDVHIIAALALHRRMTEDELRHAVGDRVYFEAPQATGTGQWSSDGTLAGTQPFLSGVISGATWWGQVGDLVIFSGSGQGTQLWSTDGSDAFPLDQARPGAEVVVGRFCLDSTHKNFFYGHVSLRFARFL